MQCGWLKDKYGFRWQICPEELLTMLASDDRAAARRAFEAMMNMVKLDLAELRKAYEGR